jgi:WhiB family transcriptional regulator, redox-sensing transcriptional regulator
MADTRRLPVPVTDIWDWQMRGACRGMDSALFFHPEGERGSARSDREAQAKQICASCPVLEQCRAHALAVHEPYGVWGGLSEAERDVIVRHTDRELRVVGPDGGRGRDQGEREKLSGAPGLATAAGCGRPAEPRDRGAASRTRSPGFS